MYASNKYAVETPAIKMIVTGVVQGGGYGHTSRELHCYSASVVRLLFCSSPAPSNNHVDD